MQRLRIAFLQLMRIGQRRPETGASHDPQLGELTDRSCDQFGHAADQPVDIDRLRIERLTPGERQQPMGQGGGPGDRGLAGLRESPHVVDAVLREPRLDHLQAAADRRQQVVEVVGQAAGELADRFHLLRLAQLLFGALQRRRGCPGLRDMTAGGEDLGLAERGDPGDPAVAAVAVPHAVLEALQVAHLRRGERVLRRAQFVRVGEGGRRQSDELAGVVAEHVVPRRVRAQVLPVARDDDHQVRRRVPHPVALGRALLHAALEPVVERLQRRLRGGQGGVGPHALGGLEALVEDADDIAVLAAERCPEDVPVRGLANAPARHLDGDAVLREADAVPQGRMERRGHLHASPQTSATGVPRAIG